MVEVYRKKWSDGGNQPPFNPDIIANLKLIKWIIPFIILVWLASGFYIVSPDEQGVIQRFGAVTKMTAPGPHYHLPAPIEKVTKVKVKQVRRIEVGFRTISSGNPARYKFIPAESHMLTGDEQIVDAQIIVQYQVTDAAEFLFNVRGIENPQGALMDAAEVALRQVVGKRPIDDVLITEKLQIEIETKQLVQQILDNYKSGLKIIEVKLQTVSPPKEVASAFSDVVSAKEDKDRLMQEAQGYLEDALPKARGQAQRVIEQAQGYKAQRTKRAEGDADRFLEVLKQYSKAKEVTRKRLYLETMEKVLPGIRKFVIDKDAGGNMLQFLPLDKSSDK